MAPILLYFGSAAILGIPNEYRDLKTARRKITRSYGPKKLDIYPAENNASAPFIVHVHGGEYHKGARRHVHGNPDFFNSLGWGYVAIDYRGLSQVPIETQKDDVALAIKWLRSNGAEYGLDPARIVLSGYLDGCHLATLAALDGSVGALAGLICNTTNYYDVPLYANSELAEISVHFEKMFGKDEDRWRLLSPTNYINNNNCPATFLTFFDWQFNRQQLQFSKSFLRRLIEAGVSVSFLDRSDRYASGKEIDREGKNNWSLYGSSQITEFLKSLT
jgi:acetyl esterase/lipase